MIAAAPLILGAGAVAAAGIITLHLLASDEAPRRDFPTARFVPTMRVDAVAFARVLRDVPLLVVRLAFIAAAVLAALSLTWPTAHRGTARVFVVDRSRSVGEASPTLRTVRDAMHAGDAVIVFDSAARSVAPDSLAAALGARAQPPRGRLSAGLVAGIGAARDLAQRADTVELVVVSPLSRESFDAATVAIRASWHGPLRVLRVAADTLAETDRRLAVDAATDDPIRATLSLGGRRIGAEAPVRLVRRAALSAADTSAARAGATIVYWPVQRGAADSSGAVASSSTVVVANFARAADVPAGRAVAHWSDGRAAAGEVALGSGCVRTVAVPIADAGDFVLRTRVRRFVDDMLVPCGGSARDRAPADSAQIALLTTTPAAPAVASVTSAGGTALTPWWLALALVALALEQWLRPRRVTA